MTRLLLSAALLMLAGCSYSRIHVEHARPTGDKLVVDYFSCRDLLATLDTNGTFTVSARATEPTDATTRQIQTIFKGLTDLGVSAAKQGAIP
jgi:hypothetical protein